MPAILALLFVAQSTYLFPIRPGQNDVRYYDFQWRVHDFEPGDGAGVRLYHYQRERDVAEIALRSIADSYRALRIAFRYAPTARIPYVLYSSHREFRSTNLFEINEFVLGVTSPQDLKMSLPYWGELRRFREVSTHEMAHQFTIQKARDASGMRGVLGAFNPLAGMPLWFIEGIAEYYAHGPAGGGGDGESAIDEETWSYMRDLVQHPDPSRGWLLGDFFDDRPGSFVHTYKLGQVRIAWLVSRYGEGRVQEILSAAPAGAGVPGVGPALGGDFDHRLASTMSSTPEAVDRDFKAWLRRKVYADYLAAKMPEESMSPPLDLPGEPDEIATTADGERILYRSVERGTGAATLYLVDPDFPDRAEKVVSDQRPGLESLHPVARRVMALGEKKLVYAGQSGPADRLFVRAYSAQDGGRFELGDEESFDLDGSGILEISDPALSPDEARVAFVGLTDAGFEDVFVIDLATAKLRRLTRDEYSERDLAWTGEGLVLATDRTPSGRYGLARLDPHSGAWALLAHDRDADLRRPAAGKDRVIYERHGPERADVWRLARGTVARITDLATGLGTVAPGAPDGLWLLTLMGGRNRVVRLPERALLPASEAAPVGVADGATEIPRSRIPDEAPAYRPFSAENWALQGAGGGVTTGAIGGVALVFADTLRDRRLALLFNIYGSLDLTDAFLIYEDLASRFTYRAGAYHTFREQRDLTFPEAINFYLQREYGLLGGVAYPFDPFQRLELVLSAGGVNRQSFTDFDGDRMDAWRARSGGSDTRVRAGLAYGWDSTFAHPYAGGPIRGFSAWLEAGPQWLPSRGDLSGYTMLDLQKYFHLAGRSTFLLRAAGGGSLGGSRFREQFFLSSYDNLRGYDFGDFRLLGTSYYVGQAELRLPLDALIQVAFLPAIQFVAAMDFGGVADHGRQLWDNRTLAGVLGTNMLFGPFFLRLHFAKPIDIGGIVPNDGWNTNFSVALFGL